MKKYKVNLFILTFLLTTLTMFGFNTLNASAYTLEKWADINSGMSYTNNRYIIAHETANPNAGLRNEANNMINNWQRQGAFTQYIVGTDSYDGKVKVVQVASPGKIAWGAGNANGNSYAQVELANTTSKAQFNKEYPVYVNLLRDLAIQSGIPLTLDNPINGKGIISHDYVSKYLWQGDWHTDPYGYLASMGISKFQFAKDLQTGLKEDGSGGSVVKPVKPNKPEKYVKKQTVDVDILNVRKSASTNSQVVRQVKKGQVLVTKNQIQGTSIVGLDGNSYNTWFELKDGGWVSGALVTEVKENKPTQPNKPKPPVSNSGWIKENGTFSMNTTINIRSNASTNSQIVGTYYQGQSVNYDSFKVDNNGYVWIHYVSYSGQDRYMATGNSSNGIRTTYWGNFY